MRRSCSFLTLFSLLFWCFATVVAQQSSSATGKLVGDVADAFEGVPIPGASVFVHGRDGAGDKRIAVGVKGGFELTLAPGLYDVFVAASGFAPMCKKLAIVAGRSVEFKARLRADDEHMQESSR
jgi:hypothetical protein